MRSTHLELIDMDEPAQCFPVAYAAASDVVRCNVVRSCFSMMDAEKNICVSRE